MLNRFTQNNEGGVSVEASFLLMIMIALSGATIEAGYAYFQWNGAQQAARHGARLAATSDPVAGGLKDMTGIGGNVEAGDTMPAYERSCAGKTQSCNQGVFDNTAMNKIIFGPDNDGVCQSTERERRGMCDVFGDITKHNVEISYVNSGLGTAGYPANIAPLVTVTVTDMKFDFVFLDLFAPESFSKMPDVSVSIMAEDLNSGT